MGANINVKVNMEAKVSTILAPEGKLKVRLKNMPIIALTAPMTVESASITGSLFVKR